MSTFSPPPLLFAGLDAKRASAGGKGKHRVTPDGQRSGNVGEGMMKTHCTYYHSKCTLRRRAALYSCGPLQRTHHGELV